MNDQHLYRRAKNIDISDVFDELITEIEHLESVIEQLEIKNEELENKIEDLLNG